MSEKNEFPRISIIIPSYNKVKYIGETLWSIVSQKYPSYEVIIQDGGSVDGTVEVIKKYAKKYSSIMWESKKDRGQVDAINKGLRRATGKIVTYVNADDVYLDNALRTIGRSYIETPDKMWFVGKGIVIDGEGKENVSIFYRFLVKPYKDFLLKLNIRPFLLCVNYIMQPSVFLNRNVVSKIGFFFGNSKFVTEYKMWLDLSSLEMPVVINKSISAFRMTADNITSTRTGELLAEDFDLIKKYTKNPFILGLHLLNNLGRLISIKLIK
ncbi:MAG: Glycosyl transferase family 2 [Candidatus Woesebacteria bacterium GW2011_GWB1_38_5b]|uniref:Glycosyl transferase family 2 n=1 Tax=Candidatus Woesebacteria bacterium GW2011_GWB1_38_5b TaxID=1618569 RepID=A0A0G0MQ12_9BACT|nr:MAG: Glycosyl transferase family 2 [Candidatus Woesebacteria bacterium GW2011_GWB1_38_5b]